MHHTEYHNDKYVLTAEVEFIDGNLRDRIVVDINSRIDAGYLRDVIDAELIRLGYKVRK